MFKRPSKAAVVEALLLYGDELAPQVRSMLQEHFLQGVSIRTISDRGPSVYHVKSLLEFGLVRLGLKKAAQCHTAFGKKTKRIRNRRVETHD